MSQLGVTLNFFTLDSNGKHLLMNTCMSLLRKYGRWEWCEELGHAINFFHVLYNVQLLTGGTNWPNISSDVFAQLLRPIFELPQVTEISDQVIDRIIGAMQRVSDEADVQVIDLNQHTVRVLILHIISTLDKVTKRCWLHRSKNCEPSSNSSSTF